MQAVITVTDKCNKIKVNMDKIPHLRFNTVIIPHKNISGSVPYNITPMSKNELLIVKKAVRINTAI